MDLPTQGAFEYDYDAGVEGDNASGVVAGGFTDSSLNVYRRVTERRVYREGNTMESRMTYSRPESISSNLGYVLVKQFKPDGVTLLAQEKHYYFGSPTSSFALEPTAYSPWKDGREYQTEALELSQSPNPTVLRRTANTWQQPQAGSSWPLTQAETGASAKVNNPQITESTTTLEPAQANQVAKQTFAYDKYTNKTDVYEYDYATGVAGALLRRSSTSYLTTNGVNSVAYDTLNPNATSPDLSVTFHLRSLPVQQSVYNPAGVERARTTYEYDNYSTDSNHAGIQTYPRSGHSELAISGLDSGFSSSTNNLGRGNATAVTQFLLNSIGAVTGSITAYAQYDVAGNVVKAIDARGYATTIDFADRFGAPDAEARANAAPLWLSAENQYSYAFPTLVTNPLGQPVYTQFDYYLGKPVDGEDANFVVTSGFYNDDLDRPKQIVHGSNQNAALQSQTTFAYDDTNRVVTTTSDQVNYNDNALQSQTVYDGLGRTTEKRTYEGGGNYITVQQEYDELGRAYKTSNPFRQGETARWTTTAFDALGRLTSLTTPDSAVVSSACSGDRVLVTDQTGKQRISRTNALRSAQGSVGGDTQ